MFDDSNILGGIKLDKEKKPKNNYTRSEMINDIKEMKETILLLTRKLEEVKVRRKRMNNDLNPSVIPS